MKDYIIKELIKNNLDYIKIENQDSLIKIYNLFKDKVFIEPTNEMEYLYYGVYYENEKDYDLMKKYYLMAISQNNSAMNNLGYYRHVEKDYNLMKKYYLMAVDQNNSSAINNLKNYYKQNTNDHSFVELYKYEQFLDLFNERFVNDINLEKEYYYSFLQWKTDDDKIKMKQYILRKTGVFPRKYEFKYLINFMETVNLKSVLSKDIMYLIAGHLFV